MYLQGQGVEKNPTEGIRLLISNMNKGESGSINYLGLLYELGEYVKKDIIKALEYYRAAAMLEYTMAYYNLALLFDTNARIDLSIDYPDGKYFMTNKKVAKYYYEYIIKRGIDRRRIELSKQRLKLLNEEMKAYDMEQFNAPIDKPF
jgi:TPR repeat protein